MEEPTAELPERFGWRHTGEVLRAAMQVCRLECAERGAFTLRGDDGEELGRLRPPSVLSPAEGEDSFDYLHRLPEALGREVVLLLRAGSAALGLWEDDELVAHKVFTRYVVRGKGRAQPTHLKTKGKSRYGARLRLRNAQALLEECNERLQEWWQDEEHGPFDRVYWSMPIRMRTDLFEASPAPPFDREDPRMVKIALHVHEPRHEELLRIRRALCRGAIETR